MTKTSDAIEAALKEIPLVAARRAFGKPGIDAAFATLDMAKRLFRHVEVERLKGRVVIFYRVGAGTPGTSGVNRSPLDLGSLAAAPAGDIVIEVGLGGTPYKATLKIGLTKLANTAVVYHWHAGHEEVMAGKERQSLPKLDPGSKSQLAIPTFSELREALESYAVHNVRESTCYLFNSAWRGNGRLVFKARPEATMRRSLTQFLRNRMGADHDVLPEQPVDESHPVDIRVTPRLNNNRMMLVEIKWMGRSIGKSGLTNYGPARAREGAKQLADYLDSQQQSSPARVVQGYYVIIDGRRRNLGKRVRKISRQDGFYYETRDVAFDPEYHRTRGDFDPPFRMFARPHFQN